jgi:ATP-binding cassette subfamily C (CFTR/MRP) protein 1
VTLLIAVAVAVLAVALRRSTSAGYLGVALSQLVGFSTGLSNLLIKWAAVENGVVSLERVHDIVQVVPESALRQVEAQQPSVMKAWPNQGQVEFRNVSLRYR